MKKIKAMSSNKKTSIEPLRLLIAGGEGIENSHLMETISTFLTKTINLYSGSPNKPNVLVFALTGVAAININETTINSELTGPPNITRYTPPRLSDSKRAKLSDLYLEISMVSNIRLPYIHKRLYEIFGCRESQAFSKLSIIAVVDLLQLPPTKSPQIFEKYNSTYGDFFKFWSVFLMVQLSKVMR